MEMKIRVQFSELQFLSANGWGALGNPFRDKIFKVVPVLTVFLCTLSKLEPSLVL